MSTISTVTLLVGDDTITREREKTALAAELRRLHPGLEEVPFDPDQGGVAGFVERIMTPSLFGGARLFTLRHAEELPAADLAALARLGDGELGDEFVILEADEPEEKKGREFTAFAKKLERRAGEGGRVAVRRYARPRDYEVARWLSGNALRLFGRNLAPVDAEYLVDLVGYDFDALRSELEKIDLYLDDGKPFSRAAIAEVVEGTRDMSPFELAQALGRRETRRAIDIVDSLFSASFFAPLCVSAIYRHFWALYRVRAYEQREPQAVADFLKAMRSRDKPTQDRLGAQIGVAAGLMTAAQVNRVYPMLVKPAIVEQARSFSQVHLRAVFRWLRDFDVGVKTGRVDPSRQAFQLLCLRIVAGPSDPGDVRAYAIH
jgi:DNA polymerase III delta subunit